METVLVLPLLLVLLGGVVWLGQLQVNRLRLIEADRYVTWQRANRHLSGGGRLPAVAALTPFGFSTTAGENLRAPSAFVLTSRNVFWRGVAGGVDMRLEAPAWIAGLLQAVDLMDASTPAAGTWRLDSVRGRPVMNTTDAAGAEAPNSYEGHFVLALAPGGANGYGYVGDRTRWGELGRAIQGGPAPILIMDWQRVKNEIYFQ